MKTSRLEAFSDGVLAIIANEGRDSVGASAVGGDWKGKVSPVLYLIAIPWRS